MNFHALWALILIVAGFASLALGMERHYRQVFAAPLGQRRRHVLRGAGWILLGLAVLPCCLGWGIAMGIVLWTGLLAAGVLLVALVLSNYA